MAENDNLNLGIAAAKSGDLEKARNYLAPAVKENPGSEEGWLWLGRSLTDKEQRKYCYERVLRLNPQNADAQGDLDRLFLSDVTEASTSIPSPLQHERPIRQTPTASQAAWYANPAFLWIMGIIMGLCICAVPLLFFVNSGLLDPLFFSNEESIAFSSPTIPETATSEGNDLFMSATPMPPVSVEGEMWKIRNLIAQGKHAEAIIELDRVIQFAPESDEAYYLRSTSYHKLMSQQRSVSEYQDYLNKAMADIDKAIAIRPDNGDYYMLRQYLLADLAGLQDYRVDSDHITEYALENARAALNLGSTLDQYPDRIYAIDLMYTNRCEEALQELQAMIDRTDPNDSSIGGLYHTQSQAYICLNQVDKAIEMVDKSMFNNTNMQWKYELKAYYLYQAGRSDEALELLNQMIEQRPSYNGWRYYLRALIYQEMGERDKAEEDLMIGAGNTWSHVGLYPYVQGKMALEDGDREEGIFLLQEAEATLNIMFTPLRKRIQTELDQLGAKPLQMTPSVMLEATSMPTIPARPTARPLLITPPPTPETGTPTSSLPLQYPSLVESAIIVDIEKGTGRIVLLPEDYPLFRFQPVEPIKVRSVKNLSIRLVSSTQTEKPSIHIGWFATGGGWFMNQDPIWGDNPVEFPNGIVYPEGDVFLAVRNWGDETTVIDNLIVSIIVETEDGRIITLGPP